MLPGKHLTVRAVTSGMLIGGLLTPCNIYSGLKIGWSFNISIIALLIVSGFWALLARLQIGDRLAPGEVDIAQTAASSSANIISGGLVATIPALAILSGENLPLLELVTWVCSVSLLGIWVAWYLRGSLIMRSELPFPTGRATAEALLEIFEKERGRQCRLFAADSGPCRHVDHRGTAGTGGRDMEGRRRDPQHGPGFGARQCALGVCLRCRLWYWRRLVATPLRPKMVAEYARRRPGNGDSGVHLDHHVSR